MNAHKYIHIYAHLVLAIFGKSAKMDPCKSFRFGNFGSLFPIRKAAYGLSESESLKGSR